MSKYGYARCSTTAQKQDLERQFHELKAKGVTRIFSEYVSGIKSNRQEFINLQNTIQPGDTICVTEVSRLSRSLHDLCHIVEDAKAKKYRIECGALTLDYTDKVDPMHLALYQLMGVFSELERGLTVERINSGLKNAKLKGKIMGRPRKTLSDIPQVIHDILPDFLAGKFGKAEFAKKAGISRPTLYKYLDILGVHETPKVEFTIDKIPLHIRQLYRQFKAGEFNKSEFAHRAKINRDTVYRYIKMLDEQG